jgi:hypothetical protein
MSCKKSLEVKIERVMAGRDNWFEPARRWVRQAVSLCSVSSESDLSEIKDAFSQMTGLNLFLKDKKVVAKGDTIPNSPKKTSGFCSAKPVN